jgi:uncharacterized repeat protein (TIGR01451 family)
MNASMAAVAALAMVAAAGCNQNDSASGSARYDSDAWVGGYGQPTKAAEPAPMAKEEPRRMFGCGNYAPAAGPGMMVSTMAFPTGSTSTSAIVVHQVMPKEVRLNKDYNYELHVTNLTEGTLQNVLVTLQNTANQTVVSSVPASSKGANNTTQWLVGDLPGCKTQVIKVTAKADKVGSSSDCITVSYNNAMCAATNVVEPALAVTKSGPAEVLVCDTITYKFEVKNTGSSTLDNVHLKDSLPAGLTTTDGKSALDVALGSLSPGQAKQVTVTAKAAKTGSYDNSASAMADGDITASSNKTTTVVKQPTLAIETKCGANILIGRNTTCTYTVKNNGNAVASGTVVSGMVPAGTSFVSADNGGAMAGGKVNWNVGNLNPGESKTLSMTVKSGAAGQIKCEGMANAACASQVSAECVSTVQGSPDVGTLLNDGDGVVNIGDLHVYTYEVMNQGQVDLTNTKVVVTLPEGMEFVSSTAPKAPVIEGRKLTFTGVTGVLKPNEKRVFTMTVKCSQAGEKLVISETTCDQLKTPVRDDELTNFVAP